jgi:hypothetical protein
MDKEQDERRDQSSQDADRGKTVRGQVTGGIIQMQESMSQQVNEAKQSHRYIRSDKRPWWCGAQRFRMSGTSDQHPQWADAGPS